MTLVLFAISVLTFLIFQAIPNGDPAQRMAGRLSSPETVAAIRRTWGFDDPLWQQYLTTMKKIFTGDVISYTQQVNVLDEIWQDLPATLSLAIGAGIIWLVLGIVFGVLSAMRAGRFTDRALTVLALVGVSTPVFLLGAVALYFLAFKVQIFPNGGYVPLTQDPARLALPHDPAVARAERAVHRHLLARAALEPARHDERGLRAHRAREGDLASGACSCGTCCATR